MSGVPFGMAISFSDGTVTNSTGVPYFYVAKFDPIVKNIEANNLSTLALSEAQSDYCKVHKWDPEDPLCSRVTLIGKVVCHFFYIQYWQSMHKFSSKFKHIIQGRGDKNKLIYQENGVVLIKHQILWTESQGTELQGKIYL